MDGGAVSADKPEIDRVEGLTTEEFVKSYFKKKRPVLMVGAGKHWPAMGKWSLEWFADLEPRDQLYTEAGNVIQGEADFAVTNLRDYLRRLMDPADPIHDVGGKKRPYLSLINIFRVFPQLAEDVDVSILTDRTYLNVMYGWIGPAGTVTGYHTDWSDNILTQIVGRKRLMLVPPNRTRTMYVTDRYEFRSELSAIEPTDYDPARFPLYQQADPVTVVLEPGDMLYVPPRWWHRVESLDISISINNFGQDLIGLVRYEAPARVREALHRRGLYRRTCTCHMWIDGKRVAKTTKLVGAPYR